MSLQSPALPGLRLDVGASAPPQEGVLERVALALNSTLGLPDALKALAQITLEETDGDRSTVFLLEDHTLVPAAAIGTKADVDLWPAFRSMGPIDLDAIPGAWELCAAGRALRVDDAQRSELIPREWAERFCLGSVVLVPLLIAEEPGGLMVVDYRRPNLLSPAQVRLLEAIASYAGVAIRNARLFQTTVDQLRNLQVLHHVQSALSERRTADELLAGINELLDGHRIKVERLLLVDRRLRADLQASGLSAEQRELLKKANGCVVHDGALLVPLRVGRRVMGALQTSPAPIGTAERDFLETFAASVAEIATRSSLRNRLERARRERAVATERERIAEDLHDTAGQVFLAIQLLCKRYLEVMPPDSQWRGRLRQLLELGETGKWEIDQAVRALAQFPTAQGGIVPALRAMATTFSADSGIDVIVDVYGDVSRLAPKVDRALYRVTHEALVNAWAHARCSTVRIALTYEDDVLLTVIDDGIGLVATSETTGTRGGLMAMRKAIEQVTGSLRVRDAKPLGVRVEARVPKESW